LKRLATALAVYAAVLGAAALVRWHLWTYGADTGTFAQAIADGLHGMRDGPEQGTHFRFHWAPLLIVLEPLVLATRTPLVLQFIQIALIGATAIPLYALARRYVGEPSAGAYAVLALLYPPLTAVAFTEFHEIAFYPAIALALVWAADARRWVIFALLALASAGIREETCMVLVLVGFGFVLIAAVAARRPRAPEGAGGLLVFDPADPRALAVAGLGLAFANVVALAVYFGIVIPRLGGWQPQHFYTYSFASGPLALVVALALHPQNAAAFATFGRLTYVIEALAPLAFLPFRSRWTWLAVPGLAIVLLSSEAIAWRMGSHYSAVFAPWLLLATVAVLVRFERRRSVGGIGRAYRAAVALCIVVLVFFDPLHPAHYLKAIYPTGDAERALRSVPRGASVATHDEWYTRIALRDPAATIFYCPYVDYAVYARDFPGGAYHDYVLPRLERDVRDGIARPIATFGEVVVYRRTPPPGATPRSCVRPGDPGYHDLPPLRYPIRYPMLKYLRAANPRPVRTSTTPATIPALSPTFAPKRLPSASPSDVATTAAKAIAPSVIAIGTPM